MISPTNALDGLKQTIVCGDLVGYDGICNQQYCMWMCLHHARQLPIRRGIMMISGFQGCLFSDKPRSHSLERDPIWFFFTSIFCRCVWHSMATWIWFTPTKFRRFLPDMIPICRVSLEHELLQCFSLLVTFLWSVACWEFQQGQGLAPPDLFDLAVAFLSC